MPAGFCSPCARCDGMKGVPQRGGSSEAGSPRTKASATMLSVWPWLSYSSEPVSADVKRSQLESSSHRGCGG